MVLASDTDSEIPEKKASGGGLIPLVVLALVSMAGAFGVVFFLSPSPSPAALACGPGDGGAAAHQPLALEDHVYVELQEILVTIGNEPATRYVKIQTSVISDSSHMGAVKKAEPMLVDAFVGYLRALQLTDFESADFYPKMREQLAMRSEIVLGADASHGVLVTEFLLR
jgi:flagellar protein FliL